MLGPDATTVAHVMSGQWENPPEPGWRYAGLTHYATAFRPGDLIVPRVPPYGFGLRIGKAAIDLPLAGGIIAPRDFEVPGGLPTIRVTDIRRSIRALSAYVRNVSKARYIAITGSVGKSSTSLFLQHVLRYFGAVATTNAGQSNVPIGVSLVTAQAVASDFCVCEVAASATKSEAAAILRPEYVMVTALTIAHGESIGSLYDIAKRKAALVEKMQLGGVLIINRDIPYFDVFVEAAKARRARIVTYGMHRKAQYRVRDRVEDRIIIETGAVELDIRNAILGNHVAVNAAGVVALSDVLDLDLKTVARLLESAHVPPRRGQAFEVVLNSQRIRMIDDSHNANPLSMEMGLRRLSLERPGTGGRRIAVLADMLELGDGSADYHKALVPIIENSKVDAVFATGNLMPDAIAQLSESIPTTSAPTPDLLKEELLQYIRDGDVVLFKGSKSTRLHRLAAQLRNLDSDPVKNPANAWFYGAPGKSPIQQRTTPGIHIIQSGRQLLSSDGHARFMPQRFVRLALVCALMEGVRSQRFRGAGAQSYSRVFARSASAEEAFRDISNDEPWPRKHISAVARSIGASRLNLASPVKGNTQSDAMAPSDVTTLLAHIIERDGSFGSNLPERDWKAPLGELGPLFVLGAGSARSGYHVATALYSDGTGLLLGAIMGAPSLIAAATSLRECLLDVEPMF